MKIFVAIPAYDGRLFIGFAQALLAEQSFALRCGDDFSVSFVSGNAGIVQARNQLVQMFLESPCDKLVFIDADVTWETGALVNLAHHRAEVVGGCYRYKLPDEQYPMRFLPGERWADDRGLIEVECLPTGFLAISRSVFQAMIERAPAELQALPGGPKIHSVFQMPVIDDHLHGEDFYFCKKWREMGGKIHLDPEIDLTHWGFTPTPHRGHIGNWLKAQAGLPTRTEALKLSEVPA